MRDSITRFFASSLALSILLWSVPGAAHSAAGTAHLVLVPCELSNVSQRYELYVIKSMGTLEQGTVKRSLIEVTVPPEVAYVTRDEELQPGLYSVALNSPQCGTPAHLYFSVAAGRQRTVVIGTTRRFVDLPGEPLPSVIVLMPFAGLTAHLEVQGVRYKLSPSIAYGVRDGTAAYFAGLRPGRYRLWINTIQFAFCKELRVTTSYNPLVISITPEELQRGFSHFAGSAESSVCL